LLDHCRGRTIIALSIVQQPSGIEMTFIDEFESRLTGEESMFRAA
jgi:hypothetical protein